MIWCWLPGRDSNPHLWEKMEVIGAWTLYQLSYRAVRPSALRWRESALRGIGAMSFTGDTFNPCRVVNFRMEKHRDRAGKNTLWLPSRTYSSPTRDDVPASTSALSPPPSFFFVLFRRDGDEQADGKRSRVPEVARDDADESENGQQIE